MPSHHRVSYNSDSSLRPNEDNLLLILKLAYQNRKLEFMCDTRDFSSFSILPCQM